MHVSTISQIRIEPNPGGSEAIFSHVARRVRTYWRAVLSIHTGALHCPQGRAARGLSGRRRVMPTRGAMRVKAHQRPDAFMAKRTAPSATPRHPWQHRGHYNYQGLVAISQMIANRTLMILNYFLSIAGRTSPDSERPRGMGPHCTSIKSLHAKRQGTEVCTKRWVEPKPGSMESETCCAIVAVDIYSVSYATFS